MNKIFILSERRTKWITSNGVENRATEQSFDIPMDAQKFMSKLIFSLKNNLFEIIFKLIFFSLLLIGLNGWGQTTSTTTTENFTTPGLQTWTCPAGVFSIDIECWGAGGGGGGAKISSGSASGGGGAGGGYVKRTSYPVTPGNSYTIFVGNGGTAGANTGIDGGDGEASYFIDATTIMAVGGNGGKKSTTTSGNGAGGAAKSTGNVGFSSTFSYYGGSGGTGSSGCSGGYYAGGGGASAGNVTSTISQNGACRYGGTAPTGGVVGSDAGWASSGNGSAGTTKGSGGSGGKVNSTTGYAGGAGGSGQISITYSLYTTVTATTAGSYEWTPPCGVTSVIVEAWGGGGGGGNCSDATNGGSGGGGGAYSKSTLTVIPNVTYYYNVGNAGSGASSSNSNTSSAGGDSWFNASNAVPTSTAGVLAKGGNAGLRNAGSAGAGGSSAAGFGTDCKYSGGSGGTGDGNGGGGGGSSAGTGASGNNGVNGSSASFNDGGASPTGGGAGGAGRGTGGSGSIGSGVSGSSPGGGGGGSDDASNKSGGNGASGRVVITYVTPTIPVAAVISSPANAGTNVNVTGTTLNWTNGGGASTYNVYFGTNNPPTNIVNGTNQAGTSYDPGTLSGNTTYYWRIDAVSSGGCNTTEGMVWIFTTATSCLTATNTTTTSDICETQTKGLTGTPSGGTWSVIAGGGTISGTTYTPADVAANTTATVRYTIAANGGCSATTSDVSFTVTPTVTINAFSPATSTRCQGAATVTTTTTATNSTGITYSLDATTLAFSGNSINASTGAVTYAAGWSGTTTITASAAGCSGPVTTTHVVTTTSSNPTVSTTVASGDFIWYGSSTAWNTLSNWKTFNGSTYSVPSVAPSLNDRVIISSTNTCVTSQPILGSNTTIGSLIVEAGATLDQSVYNLTVKGDFTNNGTFTSGAGTTIFNGTSAQTINGNSNTTFNNLTLNNSAGLTVSKGITINGVLTFTSGNISASSSTEAVTFETTGSVSGAADTKCIVGFCKKNTNSTTKFTFPVGTSTLYRQASVTPSSSSATTWTVKYYGAGYGTYTVTGGSIYQPSKREYWTIDRSGASDATIELSWGSNSNVYAPNASDLIVAHFTGTAWENAGGNNISGTSSGVVSSNTNWSAYSPFTLGSQQYAVTLPITLVSFNAKPYQKDVKVSWQTASEVDNDYFTLERSENGKDFSEITRVDGAGNSVHTISYFTMDSDFDRTILYYRLKLTSFHGEETYSDIISVDMSQTQNKGVIIMTVNSLGQEVDETAKGIVFDIYSDGTSVKRIQF